MSTLEELIKNHIEPLQSGNDENSKLVGIIRDLLRKSSNPVSFLTSLSEGKVHIDLLLDDLEASSNLLVLLQKNERVQQENIKNAANKLIAAISFIVKAFI